LRAYRRCRIIAIKRAACRCPASCSPPKLIRSSMRSPMADASGWHHRGRAAKSPPRAGPGRLTTKVVAGRQPHQRRTASQYLNRYSSAGRGIKTENSAFSVFAAEPMIAGLLALRIEGKPHCPPVRYTHRGNLRIGTRAVDQGTKGSGNWIDHRAKP
jgi:hypothetical protein